MNTDLHPNINPLTGLNPNQRDWLFGLNGERRDKPKSRQDWLNDCRDRGGVTATANANRNRKK